ncbi:hypothetical protein PPSIR1_16120 [Plesiocystis pacifica SIR-1]|uniref:DUF3137 domain-containing protein n=1 Tax=Plesiocystis pacifica SIR-1 TaxID=391625 RepID=A6GAV2_9BACT|nr:hypothetical protein [Plesiocystis pacifica]EDM77043.1 hypothetical protein PPSIR1_16120 [Plesiocystis pacifica SIR-1]
MATDPKPHFLDHRDRLRADLFQAVGERWEGRKVRVDSGPWTLILDSYDLVPNDFDRGFTRLSAPFLNPETFRFTIYEQGPFAWLGKLLGMQDIHLGEPGFDSKWIVQSNSPPKIRELFDDPRLRDGITAAGDCEFTLHDDEGVYDRLVGVSDLTTTGDGANYLSYDELLFSCAGIRSQPEQLRAVVDLFCLALERLCQFSSAYADQPAAGR